MPLAQIMCKLCATFEQNKRSNACQHAHLRDIVAVRIAQLVHASRHALAQTMRNVVVLSGCVPLKWHVVARHSAELCVTVLRASVKVVLGYTIAILDLSEDYDIS